MRRFHEAKINNLSEVVIWGDGKAMREFLFVDDMSEASIFVLEIDKEIYYKNVDPMISHINVGTSVDVSILELAETMKKVVGYKGSLKFDSSKPKGPPRKLVDSSKLKNMGWAYKVDLKQGLEKTYEWYLKKNL